MRESLVRDQGNAGQGIFDWTCDGATGTCRAAGAVRLRHAGTGEAVKLSVSEVVSGIKFKTRLRTKATRRNREILSVKVQLRSSDKLSMKLTLNPLLNQIPKGAPPEVARVVSSVGQPSWRAIRTLKITGEKGASGEHEDAPC